MPQAISPALLPNRDAIALPASVGEVVEGRASREDHYPIFVTGSLEETAARVAQIAGATAVGVISDDCVFHLHGRRFLDALAAVGIRPVVFTIRAGEANKTLDEAARALNWLADGPLGRADLIINFGGGVVIDLGGWVASVYMRGMRYVNVPTTLIGQVDAGIGGKLAVNHPAAKNLIGGFHQPSGVVSHVGFLDTLERRHLMAGITETIKKALIASPPYWAFIETHAAALCSGDRDVLRELVCAAGAIKAELIARDPYELDSRRTLGFGHAIAHPLETVTGFEPILHGEAVAFGMMVEAQLSLSRGLLEQSTHDRLKALLAAFDQPTCAADLPVLVDGEQLLAKTEKVRLARGGFLHLVLFEGLGNTVIADDVTQPELRAAIASLGIEF